MKLDGPRSSRLPTPVRMPIVVALLLVATAGCSGIRPGAASSSAGAPSSTVEDPSPSAPARPLPTPAGSVAPATTAPGSATAEPALVEPPVAELDHAGLVTPGALGSFSFRETGQSAPWLPGTPVALPPDAVLEVRLDPAIPVERWSAAVVPATARDEAAAIALADGAGPIGFDAPGSGAWSLMVAVTFADGLGSASYHWAVVAAD
jgi:hypothetical protein